jgi:hypothetical protein
LEMYRRLTIFRIVLVLDAVVLHSISRTTTRTILAPCVWRPTVADPTLYHCSFIQDLTKKMNVQHRTLNVQHRILYSVYLKKRLSNTRRTRRASAGAAGAPPQRQALARRVRCASESTLRNSAVFRSRLQRDSLVLK